MLIHSVDGNSRAACVVMGLFMIRFGWSVGKCFEFVRSRRPEILPRAVYMRQLQTSAKTLGYVGETKGEFVWLLLEILRSVAYHVVGI